MKHFKTFSLAIITVPFVILSCVVAVNFALDPDHIFSKGRDYPFFSRGLQFYKNAGVINNHEIKNIIAGGSLMDNFIPSEVESEMGWSDVFSLAIDGSDQSTISTVTDYALRKHSIENVLLCLQPERLVKPLSLQGGLGGGAKNFPFLYDDSRLNDLMVFMQMPRYYIKSYSRGKKQKKHINAKTFPGFEEKDLLMASKDLYAHYMGYYLHYNRGQFVSSLATLDKEPVLLTEADKQRLQENFAKYIEPSIKNNAGTQFYIVIPPATFLSRHASRNTFPYALKFLVKKLSQYPNVKIYGFANDAFNADLRLYNDLNHYHIEVARFVIQSVAHDNHRLTETNIDGYVDAFTREIDNYKVAPQWVTKYYERGNGPYPKEGYLTYQDAAKLVWGSAYSPELYNSIPRSRFLDEESYVKGETKSRPPL